MYSKKKSPPVASCDEVGTVLGKADCLHLGGHLVARHLHHGGACRSAQVGTSYGGCWGRRGRVGVRGKGGEAGVGGGGEMISLSPTGLIVQLVMQSTGGNW